MSESNVILKIIYRNGVCRSGCKTQDHKSWGDCVRAAGVQIGNLK